MKTNTTDLEIEREFEYKPSWLIILLCGKYIINRSMLSSKKLYQEIVELLEQRIGQQ